MPDPDLFNINDYYNAMTTGLGGATAPAGYGPQTAPDEGAAIPETAQATAGAGATPQGQGGGLGSMFSAWFGGGQPTTSGPAPIGTTVQPGWQQGAIGLGLGLLSGTPFNKWGPALQGYQRGAAADVARAQQANTAQYQQQQLALHREQMAQQERLAQLTGEIKDYQYAKQQGYTGSYMDFIQEKMNLQNKQYGSVQQLWVPKDPNDLSKGYDLKYYQPTSRGGFVEAQGLPPGSTPAQINKPVQTPEGIIMMPQRIPPPGPTGAADTTTAPVAQGQTIPGTGLTAKSAATATGAAMVKAQAGLPDLETRGQTVLGLLNDLERHTSLSSVTGPLMGRLPTGTASQNEAIAIMKQIEGQNFMVGIQAMRGMGALSDREGSRVAQAYSRLGDRTVSTEAYKKAINEVRTLVIKGIQNARQIAAGKMAPHAVEAPIAGGSGETAGGNGREGSLRFNRETGLVE